MKRFTPRCRVAGAADEAGFSLIEYMVALTILALLSTMVTLGFSTMEQVATSSYHRGNATNYAIVAGDELTPVIQSAIAPSVASGIGGGGSCWGTSLNGNLPHGYSSSEQFLVVAASNYAIEFCGYPSEKAGQAAATILIQPDVQACNLTSAPNAPTCPLVEYDLGSSYCTISTSTGLCPTPTSGVVNTVERVWCDSYCQGTSSTRGTTPAYFSYCMSPPAAPSGVSADCNSSTWNDFQTAPTSPSNSCSVGSSPPYYVRMPTPFTLTQPSSTSNWSQCLPKITNVTIDLYVMPNVVSHNTPSPGSGPGVASEIVKQIGLPNAG